MHNIVNIKRLLIVDLFEEIALIHGESLALINDETTLTFAQVNQRANQLASLLKDKGISKRTPVLYCYQRSIDAIISMIALLKMGAPYVPVHPDFPFARTRLIAEDINTRFALGNAFSAEIREKLQIEFIHLPNSAQLASLSWDNPCVPLAGEDISWILYTSGSTGRPKGVMGTHLGMINRLEWMWRTQPFSDGEVCFQNTAFTTVDSFWEIFGPLCQGRALQIIPDHVLKDPMLLVPTLKSCRIQRICLVPSFLGTLLTINPDLGSLLPETKLWIVSGEPLSVDICRRFYAAIPDGHLSNQYGLTESCADITWADTRKMDMDALAAIGEFAVPIGQPIDNVKIYILDENLIPLPEGEEGGIYISGDSVSAGYHLQQALTEQYFLQIKADSAVATQLAFTGVLLRTGDRGCIQKNGLFAFRGRCDDQLKINGYRVEPGEIESVIQRHPYVKDAAVVLQRLPHGGARLVACYTVKSEHPIQTTSIKQTLRVLTQERLPGYMQPSLFIEIKTVPRTSSGKVDRKSIELYLITLIMARDQETKMQTKGAIEEWIVCHWERLVGRNIPSAESNFFALGGHSLLAMQLLASIHQHYGVCIEMRDFFNAPTIHALAIKIETQERKHNVFQQPIFRHENADASPLSFSQQRFWFLSQLKPDSAVYHIPLAFKLRGELNVDRLRLALQHVVAQHPLLQTRFQQEGEAFIQRIIMSTPVLQIVDMTHQPEGEAIYIQQDAMRRMDLAEEGGTRFTLVKLSDLHHCLVMTFHHIISDGWSLDLFLRQLGETYSALCHNHVPQTYRQNICYFDFIDWEEKQLSSLKWEKQRHYWQDQLQACEALLTLPTDLPRQKSTSYRGAIFSGRVSKNILDAVKTQGLSKGATPFITFLAAFSMLLSRYCGKDDILIGTPVSNRQDAGIEHIFGPFVNTVAIRCSCQSDITLGALLDQVRETTLKAFENQNLPFEKIVEAISCERHLSFNPIVQVMFDYQHYNELQLSMPNLAITPYHIDTKSSRFDLSLTVIEESQGALLKLEYSTDLFYPKTIGRLCDNFLVLLEAIAVSIERSVADYSCTNRKEEKTRLSWNNTVSDFPIGMNITQHIRQIAVEKSAETAVICGDQELSYAELEKRSNKLARYLRSQGAEPDKLVAVLLERSVEMVVALLAVMKAGAAYVPIDPAYPAKRIDYMLEQSKAILLITSEKLAQSIARTHLALWRMDADWNEIIHLKDCTLTAVNVPEDLAYVIFTSGSTGNPKGVQVVHHGLINLLLDMQRRLRVTSSDKLLSVTSISFDIAGLELYLPLMTGGKLIIAAKDDITNGELLVSLLNDWHCTIMQATPVTWRLLLAANWQCPNGFKILSGGESLSEELARSLVQTGAELWNMYGPTETTIWSTAECIYPGFDKITIGRPLANTTIHILDEKGKAVPIGVPGNLYIGGVGLARGYHQRDDLTLERFTYSAEGERLYFTGDIARFLADGRIDFIGRSDNQIKMRGFRIELGEIEKCLELSPAVKQAIVVPVHQVSGDISLVAHVIPKLQSAMEFSLFYFSAGFEKSAQKSYQFYLESAKRADVLNFKAIWTPERHFHPVGGQFPNPSVLSAAIAVNTQRIQIRAGSVVLPLHNPLRIAEEWAVIDNLSAGRVGLAFASGWNPKDFVLAPESYSRRREVFREGIETVKSLWRGESILVKDGEGNVGHVSVYPRPLQKELEIWVTASGDPATFIEAGKLGANLLTHLLGQSVETLAEKISVYRNTLREAGYKPELKTITLMLHTFIQEDKQEAIETCHKPFSDYLRAHLSLENMAKSFGKEDILSQHETDEVIELAFERYSKTSSLIGSVDSCLEMVSLLKGIGVNEIACLVDFGIESASVLNGIEYLGQLNDAACAKDLVDYSLLKEHLRAHLPEYMVPAHIVTILEFPMTSNGKVDRKRLQEEAGRQEFVNTQPVSLQAQTRTQKELLSIWCDLLKSDISCINANFFTLGGHSLLATQLISVIRQRMHVNLPLRAVFDAPTIVKLAAKIEELESEQSPAVSFNTPPATVAFHVAPLSFAQQRLWFITQLQPQSAMYNVPIGFILRGHLEQQLFIQAFRAMLEAHDAFHTRIALENGLPVQQFLPNVSDTLQLINANHLTQSADWETKIVNLLEADAKQEFDLLEAPLFRAKLITINSDHNVFYLNIHHLIWDGWSRTIFLKELGERYTLALQNKPYHSVGRSMSYGEFAHLQRDGVLQMDITLQEHYWQKKLADIPANLSLPLDYQRPNKPTFEGALYKFKIAHDICEKLRVIAKQHDVTLFMLLLTAYKSLIYRLTLQEDLVVGVPFANRHHDNIDKTIGLFVNSLAIRSHCNYATRFIDLAAQIKTNTLEAWEHQDIPFEKVALVCSAPTRLNIHPVFQTMFDMQNVNEWQLNLPEIKSTFFEVDAHTARFDLLLAAKELKKGIELSFEYSTELFVEKTIRSFADSLINLLCAVTAEPEISLGDIVLQPDALPISPIKANNRENVVALFREQALIYPDMSALLYNGQKLSYRELDMLSSNLASYLINKGVAKGEPIGIIFAASLQAIVAILAILKAGAMYVPIDPDLPDERICQILDDLNCSYLLTQNEFTRKYATFECNIILCGSLENLPQDCTNIEIALRPDDLAYTIFTSGTGGTPKGVSIEHQSIVRLVKQNGFLELIHADRIALASSLTFDAATFEIWGALLNGATLVILDKTVVLDPVKLDEMICDASISVMWLTSSLFNHHISSNSTMFCSLRTLLIGGEALSLPHVIKLLSSGRGPQQLINGYGPTENTTFSTTYNITAHRGDFVRSIPVGKAIGRSVAYILDKKHFLCPMGVIGEIYLGGQGLARGYLNRPKLTTEHFIEVACEGGKLLRLYKSGDYARYLHDGNIEYVGRKDEQVKLRGFRIELGEIENALLTHCDIYAAVVILHQNSLGEKQLAAFFCSHTTETDAWLQELRNYLALRLPEYMIPTYYTAVDEIPLNASGKLDRHRLPNVKYAPLTTEYYQPPVSPTELALTESFQEVLGSERISVNDNFFLVGGHSLLMLRLVVAIERRLSISIPLVDIFEFPTPKLLAARVNQEHGDIDLQPLLTISAAKKEQAVFLIHPVFGLAIPYIGLRRLMLEWKIYGVSNPKFGLARDKFASIKTQAAYYISLIQNVQPEGPYCLGGWSYGGVVAYEMAQQLIDKNYIVDNVVLIDSFYALNPETSPLKTDILLRFMAREAVDAQSQFGKAFMEEFKHALALLMAYRPQPYSGRVTLIEATQTPDYDSPLNFENLVNDWGEYATGVYNTYPIDAAHDNIFKDKHIDDIANMLISILTEDYARKNR